MLHSLEYEVRVGNLPVDEALRRVVRCIELEAIARDTSSQAWGSLFTKGIRRESYEDVSSIMKDAYELLGNRFPSSRATSAGNEISDSIDEISKKTDEDLRWMKGIAGISPVDYLISERERLTLEQRGLFARLILSEHDSREYHRKPHAALLMLAQKFDKLMESTNPADAAVAVKYAAILGDKVRFDKALIRAADLYEISGLTIAAQFYRNHTVLVR